jgi:hypothetical protein
LSANINRRSKLLDMSNVNRVIQELAWLKANPDFKERPATLDEFLGPDYLNIKEYVRERVREELIEIIGDDVLTDRPTKFSLAMITGGIGIGKTTIASIVLPYLVHWVLCLKDPQRFFGLVPGSRIAFMQMSTSEKQALEVVFGDIKARIKHSPWFKNHPYDPSFKNQLRWEAEDVWIIPGDSSDLTFEGYNILGGIIDEADSHKVTQTRDYAEIGYDAIVNRISSRFGDRGFLMVIGQMKQSQGFAARKFIEFSARDDAYAVRLAIWDSFGDAHYADANGETKKFAYDVTRKQIIPEGVVRMTGMVEQVLWIPEVYRKNFVNNPEKALKDLAGMPPLVNDPFISLINKIEAARDRWSLRYPGMTSPVDPRGRLQPWFKAPNSLKRAAHIDLAYSGDGDACGIAMGHVPEMVKVNGELKPYIVIDFLLRIKALPGREIFLGDVRAWIYNLRDNLNFKINMVTMDGFESTDTMQQFQRRRFGVEYVSVDKQILPYHDLREAIYEDRIDFPPYITEIHGESGTKEVEILVQELSQLVDDGKKIDHPLNGSKDVSDAVAGVTFTLMGDRRYHRNQVNLETPDNPSARPLAGMASHPAFRGDSGFSAPLPPSNWSNN